MQAIPKISLIKKNRDYLLCRGKYLIGFHDHHLAHYIKNSLPETPEKYIDFLKSKCSPIPINKNVCRFEGVKLILPKKNVYVDIDMTTGYWGDSYDEEGEYAVEQIPLESFIDKPYQYIMPYEILQSYKGHTILKCNLIEKYNT
jgi:hypothetical protein